jgi:hypothetical protein
VSALLRPLAVNQESALVQRQGTSLRIQVQDAQGGVLAQRALPLRGHSCPELARAAAVVIAAWMIDLHPELAPPVAPPVRPQTPAPAPSVIVASARVVEPAGAYDSPRLQVAAGLGVAVNADGWAPEGRLQVGWAAQRRLLLRLSLLGQGQREVEVDPGVAHYALATLAPGLEWTVWSNALPVVVPAAWRLGFTADAHATAVSVEGHGFTRNLSSLTIEPRAAVGLRLARRHAGNEVWFAVETRLWLRNQWASVNPDGSSKALSRWDVGLAAGWAFWK